MARKITSEAPRYGICVAHDDGTEGWLTGKDASVLSYATIEEAQKALRQLKRDTHYSWNCVVEAKALPDNMRR